MSSDKQFLTIREVSGWLGIKVPTLYGWAADGKIPCFRLNGLLRFCREDLLEWLASCKQEGRPSGTPYPDKSEIRQRIDTVIAHIKGDTYNPPCGKPDHGRRKEDGHGL